MKLNMDVLLLILKAAVLGTGAKQIRISKGEIMRAEAADLRVARSNVSGDLLLELVEGNGSDETRIIVPQGQNPFTIIE